MSHARTEDEIFETFKGEHAQDGERFKEWWRRYWMDHINMYTDMGWRVFPCGEYSKRPVAGWKWTEKRLDFAGMVWYAARGFNLAAVAGDMVVLDFDSPAVRGFDVKTLTMVTPKGFQYWTTGPFDPRFYEKLKRAGFDTPRTGPGMYSLVPLSRTCTRDKGGKDYCLVHDNRYREWVDLTAEALPFRKVAKELVG